MLVAAVSMRLGTSGCPKWTFENEEEGLKTRSASLSPFDVEKGFKFEPCKQIMVHHLNPALQ